MKLKEQKRYVEEIIARFCEQSHNHMPQEKDGMLKFLQRMRAVGYITDKELEKFSEAIESEDD